MKIKKLILVFVLSAFFPWLFYENQIGLNLLIFNILVFIGLYLTDKLSFNGNLNRTVCLGTFLTALFVVYNGSDLAITINIISLFLLAGTTLYSNGRNLIYMAILSVINLLSAQGNFVKLLKDSIPDTKASSRVFRVLKLTFIPILIVFIFILIYRAANPVFEGMMSSIFKALDDFFSWVLQNIEWAFFFTTVFGILLANIFILGRGNKHVILLDENGSDNLPSNENGDLDKEMYTKVRNEYTSAIILFSMLNLLILIINMIDIWWVWFNFEWDGAYLKQFVHEGTYLLIISILISLGISIYYFRGDINFMKGNAALKILAYIWLGQNAILTLSVGIRNFWYIEYFSLAYLRIGVVFFLLLTLYSIYTVLIKIRNKKGSYFLFRSNSLVAYVLLVVMAFFNWDIIIAKYNFSHSETAFIHYDFLADLSPNALPYLEKSKAELADIDERQQDKFEFRRQYMNSSLYQEMIQEKRLLFVQEWPKQHWLEWNWAGERSYRKLIE